MIEPNINQKTGKEDHKRVWEVHYEKDQAGKN